MQLKRLPLESLSLRSLHWRHLTRRGLARELMVEQHRWAGEAGYRLVETRTRSHNRAMVILNLQCGFEIVGLERGQQDHMVLSFRRSLKE